jgi:serine/threonine protein kinase
MPAHKELITPTFKEPKEPNPTPQSWVHSEQTFERKYIKELIVDWSRHGVTFGRHHDFARGIPFDWASIKPISGGGGGAIVYKTYIEVKCNEKTERTDLAVKEIVLEEYGDKYLEQRLEEVKIIKRLRHKHVIELLGSYIAGDNLNLLLWPVAEFTLEKVLLCMDSVGCYIEEIGHEGLNTRLSNIESKNVFSAYRCAQKLSKFLRDEDPSVNEIVEESVRRLFQTFGCLAEAITYLHGQRVRHQDIKPANILICLQDKNFIRLTDFGIADDLKDRKTTRVTFDGRATTFYQAPEQKKDMKVGFEADVFSLGIVYLEVVVALGVDLFIRDRKAQTVKILRRNEFFKLDRWNDWSRACQTVYDHYQRDLSFLVKQLLQLTQGMLEETPTQRLKGNQILTRLGIIEQLCRKGAKAETSVSLFGPCCKAQILQREDYVLLREAFEVDGESRLAKQGPLAPTFSSTQGSNPADYAAQNVENTYSSDFVSEAPESQFANNVPEVSHLLRARHINNNGERIDPPFDCQFNDGDYKMVKNLKLCYKYILLDYCELGDACGHRHTDDGRTDDGRPINDPLTIGAFRRFQRSRKCNFGLNCNNATCIFGHNCPFTTGLPDPSDPSFPDLWVRTATKAKFCAYNGPPPHGNCKYPIDMHNMNLSSISPKIVFPSERGENRS